MKKMLRFCVWLKLTAQVPKHDTLLIQVCGLYYLVMCMVHITDMRLESLQHQGARRMTWVENFLLLGGIERNQQENYEIVHLLKIVYIMDSLYFTCMHIL
jgi:hypothetical protein